MFLLPQWKQMPKWKPMFVHAPQNNHRNTHNDHRNNCNNSNNRFGNRNNGNMRHCTHFNHGNCKFGDNCKFVHDETKRIKCKHFMNKETCPYGRQCRYICYPKDNMPPQHHSSNSEGPRREQLPSRPISQMAPGNYAQHGYVAQPHDYLKKQADNFLGKRMEGLQNAIAQLLHFSGVNQGICSP